MKDEMGEKPARDLRERTKAFALRIVRMYSALKKKGILRHIGLAKGGHWEVAG